MVALAMAADEEELVFGAFGRILVQAFEKAVEAVPLGEFIRVLGICRVFAVDEAEIFQCLPFSQLIGFGVSNLGGEVLT